MEPVRRPSPGIRVVNSDDRSNYILLEEHKLILMNFLTLLLPLLSGRIEAQKTLNPPDDRRYVLPEEHRVVILMNFLGLLPQMNFDLPAEAENSWSDMPNKYCNFRSSDELYAVISDLLSERRGRDGSQNCGEGSSSHSEAPQVFKGENKKGPFVDFNGSPPKREEPKRNKCPGMTTPEIINDFSNWINYPPGRCVSIDISSVADQEYEGNVHDGDLHGRKQEIPTNRINSPREPHVSIDVPSLTDQQQWKEHIGGEPSDTKKQDNSMMSETTLTIAAQTAGVLVGRAFSASTHFSWTANFVAVATVFGISFPLLGIGLRHVKPKLSGIMAKLGAVAMSSAIILSLGSTVVPAVAWTAGTTACLLIAIGVAMA